MIWKNKKNQKLYKILDLSVIDATNSQDGNTKKTSTYILYEQLLGSNGQLFVREANEFKEKFEFVTDQTT